MAFSQNGSPHQEMIDHITDQTINFSKNDTLNFDRSNGIILTDSVISDFLLCGKPSINLKSS
jgi:hypothetical protein